MLIHFGLLEFLAFWFVFVFPSLLLFFYINIASCSLSFSPSLSPLRCILSIFECLARCVSLFHSRIFRLKLNVFILVQLLTLVSNNEGCRPLLTRNPLRSCKFAYHEITCCEINFFLFFQFSSMVCIAVLDHHPGPSIINVR